MKFLPFFIVSFVLVVVPNGLDASDAAELYHSFRVSKEEVEAQATEIASLGQSLRDAKDQGESLTQSISRVVQSLHDLKIENQSNNNRIADGLKTFHDAKAESNWLTQKVNHAVKLFHLAKVESDWEAKEVPNWHVHWDLVEAKVVDYGYKATEPEKLKYHKSRADNVVEAENLLHALKEKGKWQTEKLEIAESLLSDKEDGKLKKHKATKQALDGVQHESKQQAKRLRSANKLVAELKKQVKAIADAEAELQDVNERKKQLPIQLTRMEDQVAHLKAAGESQIKKVVSAKKLLLESKNMNKAQIKDIAVADQDVREVENQVEGQTQSIRKIEKLLRFLDS